VSLWITRSVLALAILLIDWFRVDSRSYNPCMLEVRIDIVNVYDKPSARVGQTSGRGQFVLG